MFKRIVSILLLFTICFTLTSCGGSKKEETEEILTTQQKIEQSVLVRPNVNEDFRYNVYTHYIEITECLSTKTNIIIPDYIQDLPVFKIAANSFKDQTTFQTLDIANTVIEIGESAFEGCINLKEVNLSDNLEILGRNAFNDCENLQEVVIPKKINIIESGTFSSCTRLKAVTFESNKQTTVDTDEENIDTEVVEREICGGAFNSCDALKIVYIPEDITIIDDNAFPMSKDRFNEERIIICGREESAAANYAAINLYDFKTEAEFKAISKEFLTTQQKKINEKVSTMTWEFTLTGYQIAPKTFSYITGYKDKTNMQQNDIVLLRKTEEIKENEDVVFVKFILKNASGKTQHINHLDFNVEVDGYKRKVSYYNGVSFLPSHMRPMSGDFENGSLNEVYLAIRVPSSWESIGITYTGDISVESTMFVLNKNESQESTTPSKPSLIPTLPTEPSTEATTETSEGTTEAQTSASTEPSTTTTKTPETTTTKKEEFSTLPF